MVCKNCNRTSVLSLNPFFCNIVLDVKTDAYLCYNFFLSNALTEILMLLHALDLLLL